MTRHFKPVVAAVLLALAAGCGSKTADVTGKVTFQGKPVVYGTVVIIGSDGLPKAGDLKPDGTYRVADVAVGPVKVAVSSPPPPGSEPPKKAKVAGGRDAGEDDKQPPPAATPADAAVAKNWVPLPEKYGDPDKSGLTATVAAGQPLDLDLK